MSFWYTPLAQNAEGAVLGPFDCWLALRGLKTMALRMERQAANAAALAAYLDAHPLVSRVNYAGLPGHPGFEVNARQSASAGSLLSFETGRWVKAVGFASWARGLPACIPAILVHTPVLLLPTRLKQLCRRL